MSQASTYDPIPGDEEGTDALEAIHSEDNVYSSSSNCCHLSFPTDDNNDASSVEPLEMDVQSGDPQREDVLFRWTDPWLPTVVIVSCGAVPALVGAMCMVYELTGRIWPAWFFSLHLVASAWLLSSIIPSDDFTIPAPSLCLRILPAALDVFLFAKAYPTICSILSENFFTDIDGTTIIEYSHNRSFLDYLRLVGMLVAISRFSLETISICIICYHRRVNVNNLMARQSPNDVSAGNMLVTLLTWVETRSGAGWSAYDKATLRRILRWINSHMLWIAMALLLWATTSLIVHWGNWSWVVPERHGVLCNKLDRSECILPFPSFHFVIKDETTASGWRVKIPAEVLPRLKGDIKIHPKFLNELDGFSTMAPILFYLDGLKEAHQSGNNTVRLQGPPFIAQSVTPASITLLLDVENKKLVPHSAEIDFLDDRFPLVLLFPSQPLRHNAHYAVVVAGARDVFGQLLPPTPGMKYFLSGNDQGSDEQIRFESTVLPALQQAAPWLETMQLLFDFPTISEESQLGPIKAVRDATLAHISNEVNWDWKNHLHVIRIQNEACSSSSNTKIARTIHAKLDVPWFLQDYGPGHRGALLDKEAVAAGEANILGQAHFVVHIPCSLRASALQQRNATNLTAVVEYGHGLFYNRNEASWSTLVNMANKNGYVIMAMDWRGMSSYDLLVVVKALMSKPSLFVAVRDNLIQGYANKLALQHFAKHSMLSMDWMHFGTGLFDQNKKSIPILDNREYPQSIFYGISQGGILGAGYTTLLGPTSLIDRGVLGVPGTPFALIMSRSLDFAGYDAIMLLNFYNNRHVRIFLSLVQMLWDSCEGSGLLAPPQLEVRPPLLLQAGLGDAVVPTIAAEALTRALGGVILSNNPRQDIYGIEVVDASNGDSPKVILSELMYLKEVASLPVEDKYSGVAENDVHWCVREDEAFVRQVEEFINTGRVLDVCATDGCVRNEAKC